MAEDETANETEDGALDEEHIALRLPDYRLVRRLSETRMSSVFLAEDLKNGQRQVALKVLGPDLVRVPGFRARFERESRIALTLEHPNVVPSHAAGESADKQLCYLAMRYIHGANLLQVLNERGALGMDETIAVARQVAAALDSTHERGLIHRDVKPANIMVEEGTGHVYLCDFGIAKDTALTRLTAVGGFVGTPYYSSPEQAAGGEIDHRTDVYSLGRVIQHCLTGVSPELANGTRSRYPLVDRVLLKAMSKDPADRHASCGELVEDLAAARVRGVRRRRTTAGGLVALGVVMVLVLASVIFGGPAPEKAALDRVPAALRGDCGVSAPAVLSCRDSAGREAVSELFSDRAAVAAAYARAVETSGVARTQGDCSTATGAEHRYPVTGPAQGRVLCYSRDGVSVIVWTSDEARVVTRVEAPTADDAALRQAWAGWTSATTVFPTDDERAVMSLAAGTECKRASLDGLPTAVAGVTCVPYGQGAQEVSYYRFASLPALRDAFGALVNDARAPSGTACASAPGFLGTQRHDWLGVDVGQVLCRPTPSGSLAMEWTMEPLSVIGRVGGTVPAALSGWWSQWHVAPVSRLVDAINAQSAPPFPTAQERSLLAHIPAASRVHCVRPSPSQKWRDVSATPAVGVVCGRTSGAELVAYYQFQDAASMRAVHGLSSTEGKDCRDLPAGFEGDHSYSRGGTTGHLRCSTVKETGERMLSWTDDRLAVRAVAYRGTDPYAMIDWWTHDAGPI
ncbi:serine/threonine-protein kinase [Allokutzneria oryzae]|uniref:non-specific serine/threonine protein kinase n=1 Tax=Allokutzneria oryzae TaxID=1378989 RepID=A0ABV5ZRI9_9PSEU